MKLQIDPDETIFFTGDDTFPMQALRTFHRCTMIPNADKVLPFIVAWDIVGIGGLKCFPALACFGPSGSGKTTLGALIQLLNYGFLNPLSANSTYNGWLQSFQTLFQDLSDGRPDPYPLAFLDDLTPKMFSEPDGDKKLGLLKLMPILGSTVVKGTVTGEADRIPCHVKFIFGSIANIAYIANLSELARRTLVVVHKRREDFTEDEEAESFDDEFTDLDELRFEGYREAKLEWGDENTILCQQILKKTLKALKGSNLPINRQKMYAPIIATAVACGFFQEINDAIDVFMSVFIDSKTAKDEDVLVTILRNWLDSNYASRIALFVKYGEALEVSWKDVNGFLAAARQQSFMTSKETSRDAVISAMTVLGFQFIMDDTQGKFIKEKEDENE